MRRHETMGASNRVLPHSPRITPYGDKIVFGYAGDLYTVPATGGVARRLTSHDGYEMLPHFSPDGNH